MDILLSFKMTTTNDQTEKAKQLLYIFNTFEYDWDSSLRRITEAEVKDSASKFETFQFFEKRAEIGRFIFDNLKENFKIHHFTLISLNVLNLAFPSAFETAVEETEIVIQQTRTKEFLRDAMAI